MLILNNSFNNFGFLSPLNLKTPHKNSQDHKITFTMITTVQAEMTKLHNNILQKRPEIRITLIPGCINSN